MSLPRLIITSLAAVCLAPTIFPARDLKASAFEGMQWRARLYQKNRAYVEIDVDTGSLTPGFLHFVSCSVQFYDASDRLIATQTFDVTDSEHGDLEEGINRRYFPHSAQGVKYVKGAGMTYYKYIPGLAFVHDPGPDARDSRGRKLRDRQYKILRITLDESKVDIDPKKRKIKVKGPLPNSDTDSKEP
jgi:hypothetical protein